MAQKFLNRGTANGKNGETVFSASSKVQDNFSELYALQFFTDRIISGSAAWTTGLTFDLVVSLYVINGNVLPAASGADGSRVPITDSVTLTAADGSNPRIDLIVVNEDETISVVTGTPAASPSAPTPDFETQLIITQVLVPAGATTPDGVSEENIYLENAGEPTEWTTTESTSGTRIDLSSTSDPFAGTTHIGTSSITDGDRITFTNATTIATSDFDILTMRLKNITALTDSTQGLKLFIYVYNGSTIVQGKKVYVRSGYYGYDVFDTNWKVVSIPKEEFSFIGSEFDRIDFVFDSTQDIRIDNVRLISGTDSPGGSGSPFNDVTDSSPSFGVEQDIYRNGKIGINNTSPTELLDILGTEDAETGAVKLGYTHSDGTTIRAELGGENIGAYIPLPASTVKGHLLRYADDPNYVGDQLILMGGDFNSAGAQTNFGWTIGNFNALGTEYAAIFTENQFDNDTADRFLKLKSVNGDSDHAHLHLKTKGYENEVTPITGYGLEALIELNTENTEGDRTRIYVSPHNVEHTNLTKFSAYGSGTFVEGYTHTDTLAKTGTAATTIGSRAYLLGVDSDGNIMETANVFEGYTETGTLAGNDLDITVGDSDSETNMRLVIDQAAATMTLGSTIATITGFRLTQDGIQYGVETLSTVTSSNYSLAIGVANPSAYDVSGNSSLGVGRSHTVSGNYSAGIGSLQVVSGENGVGFGLDNYVRSFGETIVGVYGTDYTPKNTTGIDAADRVFGVANGTGTGSRSMALTIYKNGISDFGGPITLNGYTVATLPTGVVGHRVYVTDASGPTYGSTVVGGGAVTIPVFYDGTNWICA